MGFLLTKLEEIFKFTLPLKHLSKDKQGLFCSLDGLLAMPALPASHRTIAKSRYRLHLKHRGQSSFPISQQQANWAAISNPCRYYRMQFKIPTKPLSMWCCDDSRSSSSEGDIFPKTWSKTLCSSSFSKCWTPVLLLSACWTTTPSTVTHPWCCPAPMR